MSESVSEFTTCVRIQPTNSKPRIHTSLIIIRDVARDYQNPETVLDATQVVTGKYHVIGLVCYLCDI